MTDVEEAGLEAAIEAATATEVRIPVHISYEIIRLFSEGLYQSPQKAIEELVSNSYDAGATAVHVLLPRPEEEPVRAGEAEGAATGDELVTNTDASTESEGEEGEEDHDLPPLWVIDNGTGMDASGFAQLWRVADSAKADAVVENDERAPIGQFGIGKLAAYVLAWRLTHISCVDGVIRSTTMNFRELAGRHQYERVDPFDLQLYEMTEDEAKHALADIEHRDPDAWKLMFGEGRAPTWTAAALSDFKELYEKLKSGRLRWVLSTGLPLHTEFSVFVDGTPIESSKLRLAQVTAVTVGGDDDAVAKELGLETTPTGVRIPGIRGEIAGEAVIYERRLTESKADQYSRSHGFFVKVRERVVNLEDELFGLGALNHAAWARFAMEVHADGLREHLLSSREGVRESDAIDTLRKYLHGVFNACRRAYDEWLDSSLQGLDLEVLLQDAPSLFVTEPLVSAVREVVASGTESYYVSRPDLPEGTDEAAWLEEFSGAAAEKPIGEVLYEPTGRYDRSLRFLPDTRTLILNSDHPFVEKLLSMGRDRGAATLFGSSELLLDVLLQENGMSAGRRIDLFDDRDRLLRVLAGDPPSTAAQVMHYLAVANQDEDALERAVGAAFQALGFEYERRGGNVGGTDGVLYARLGRGTSEALADYRIVYDAKQTGKPSVPADKISLSSMEDFRQKEDADFAFFFAEEYEGQHKEDGKLNTMISNARKADPPQPITMLRVQDLKRIVTLHYRFGVTLTRLRTLFEEAHTVAQVEAWVDALEKELSELPARVPLHRLLVRLEESKSDPYAQPNVYTARANDDELKKFTPERLVAALDAVQEIVGRRWLEVERSGNVVIHATVDRIVAEVEKHLRDLFGVNPLPTVIEDQADGR